MGRRSAGHDKFVCDIYQAAGVLGRLHREIAEVLLSGKRALVFFLAQDVLVQNHVGAAVVLEELRDTLR